MTPSPLRWGLLGTGKIAGDFAKDLSFLDGHQVAAVGSRHLETARAFAARFSPARAHGSYEALVADPGVDIVYVATPHPFHLPNTLLALEAGKPVLVEKPFAMTGAEARQMVAAARQRGLFLLEAMWMRFLPHIRLVQSVIASGLIGEVQSVQADHGWAIPPDPKGRHFAPELGGGALLDLGIYTVSLATMLLGRPRTITSATTPAFTGVDAQTSIVLGYAHGAQALLHTTLLARVGNRALVTGTRGRIEIDEIFYTPTSFRVLDQDGKVLQDHPRDYRGHGLREQAVEAARCLREGLTESPLLPWEESIAIMDILDTVTAQFRGAP